MFTGSSRYLALFNLSVFCIVFNTFFHSKLADKESETELIHQLRAGIYHGLLPETPNQLRLIINDLTVKRPYVPRPMLNGLLHIKLRMLEEHKKSISEEELFIFYSFIL